MSCRARSWIARSAAAAPFSTQFDNFKNKSVTLRRVGTFTSWISMFHAQSTYFSIAPIAREHVRSMSGSASESLIFPLPNHFFFFNNFLFF
ncbi:hypothetical protein Y032_0046g1307 [Ancylostoma ceylanicum]|nr:hypothetical protein Y032_0046g1307 [Ancylostoma ceylanicum]